MFRRGAWRLGEVRFGRYSMWSFVECAMYSILPDSRQLTIRNTTITSNKMPDTTADALAIEPENPIVGADDPIPGF